MYIFIMYERTLQHVFESEMGGKQVGVVYEGTRCCVRVTWYVDVQLEIREKGNL